MIAPRGVLLSVIDTEREADSVAYLGKHRDHIVALGHRTIEFFYDAGLTNGSPLQRRQDIFHNIGTPFANSVIELGDEIYFIGQEPSGVQGVYVLRNFQIEKLSNRSLDFLLNKIPYPKNLSGDPELTTTCSILNTAESGLLYIMNISEVNIKGTYVLHLETGLLMKWYAGSNPTYGGTHYGNAWSTEQMLPIVATTNAAGHSGAATNNENVVMFANGHSAYTESNNDEALTDLGLTAPSVHYYTMPEDWDTNKRKRIRDIRVLHYPLADDSIDPANLTLSWVDFETLSAGGVDEDTFPAGRTIDIAKPLAVFHRCGVTRQRMFKVTLTPAKRQLIKGLEIDYDILRS